ncbi:MAG: sodium-dependent bicarbonate transport family permease, partial [Gammaproteobacteria bacterium]|nr:sodium-dependent bicarbonate transport family permease [Gammaproteobacteria bacterium]
MHSSLFASLIDPAILLFFFGIFVGAIRSNLEIPAAAAKFCSLYLLLVVGFKGGV